MSEFTSILAVRMETTPPSYPAASLPCYSEIARPNERSVVAAASQPAEDYQHKNGNLILNLGPKRPGLLRPAYGWNDLVDGYVQVKKTMKNVQSIVATIQGQVTTRLSERGLLSDQKQTVVLQASQTLYSSSSEEQVPNGGARYAFSFVLPSYVAGGSDTLPPSFSALHMGVAVEVTYFIKIEMIRKGKLRKNERIKAFFYYLPRTFAPLPRCELLSTQDEKSDFDEPDDWQSFEALPILTGCPVSVNMSDLRVSLALQHPLVYASGSAIPFALKITSGVVTEAILPLLSTLSVQLVRITTMQLGTRSAEFETLLGGGMVFRVEEKENERYVFGSVTCSHLGESSWRVDSIEVRYVMRVKVSPRRDIPSLACTLPTYLRNVPLKMKTHQTTLDENLDATAPALCRYPRAAGCRVDL